MDPGGGSCKNKSCIFSLMSEALSGTERMRGPLLLLVGLNCMFKYNVHVCIVLTKIEWVYLGNIKTPSTHSNMQFEEFLGAAQVKFCF